MSTLKGLLLCALLSASAMALPRIVETSEAEHEDAAQNGDEEHEDDRFAQIYAEIEELSQFRNEYLREMGLACDACTSLVGALIDYAKSDSSKSSLKNKLKGKCSKMSFFLRTACNYAVDNYFDQLYEDVITKHLNADKTCQLVKLC